MAKSKEENKKPARKTSSRRTSSSSRKTSAKSTNSATKEKTTSRRTSRKQPESASASNTPKRQSRKSTAQTSRTKKANTTQNKSAPTKQKEAARSTRQMPPAPSPPAAQTTASKMENTSPENLAIRLAQTVAILVDGNNIEMSLHSVSGKKGAMINFDKLVPALVGNRSLARFIYFREGRSISSKLAERLQKMFYGSVVPCYKSADIPLSIKAVQIASKVDTIIILSGDADYVELVRHLKHDGIRVEIAAFPKTTAEILRNEADYVFPITVDYSFVLK